MSHYLRWGLEVHAGFVGPPSDAPAPRLPPPPPRAVALGAFDIQLVRPSRVAALPSSLPPRLAKLPKLDVALAPSRAPMSARRSNRCISIHAWACSRVGVPPSPAPPPPGFLTFLEDGWGRGSTPTPENPTPAGEQARRPETRVQ